jgi:hypothetical protein
MDPQHDLDLPDDRPTLCVDALAARVGSAPEVVSVVGAAGSVAAWVATAADPAAR